ncbi:MAG: hypothetical protein A2096_16555 [Spirochaetes bacterium GWF1_41_5]|nr:MAG: hypothetical protein A2096_16555 [Spirochaetes bacterium GWF1_41_5]
MSPYYKLMIDDYLPNRNFSALFKSALILAGLYFFRMGAFIFRYNRMLRFGYYYIYDLRNRLMQHFHLLSFRYYDEIATFIIAHRLSTVEHADEIFVLSKGRLLQRGNHETLVRQDGLYSRIHALHRHGTGSGHDIMV